MTYTKFKTLVAYTLIISSVLFYVIGQTQIYKIYNENEKMKDEITNLKDNNDVTKIRINSLNSRETIMKQNPKFEIRDNIFYLESYE